MYSDDINPYLIARLLAVQAAFSQNGPRYVPRTSYNSNPSEDQLMKAGFKMSKRNEDNDEGESDGGGGGTARGYRGKNSALAKAKEAMRRMTRK